MSLLDRIKEHADPDRIRRLEVPEWGTDGKPLIITYSMVTLEDLGTINELDGQDWSKRSARIIALKACDEKGERLFKLGDAPEIRKVAAPEVVNRIAMAMLGRLSLDEAEKN